MATVWIGTVRGALGFRQLVAIKKPHPHLLHDEGFRTELVAEARLASLIHHANVVDVRDCEIDGESISLVMDYIEGASLGELIVAASKRDELMPVRAAVRIVRDAAAGLHAAHELVDERNRPVGLVHRDISPQNILVGTDGIGRVTDFGVAKFARKYGESTSEGSLKGKLAYMAPEYVRGEPIDRRFDVFALGVVLWESLTGKRLFRAASEAETLKRLLDHVPPRVSELRPELQPLDDVVACALAKSRDERFQNAAAMGAALETAASAAACSAMHRRSPRASPLSSARRSTNGARSSDRSWPTSPPSRA
jgi:eukaryotic-like serine/threonine-protein kinase